MLNCSPKKYVVACITAQPHCEKIIEAAKSAVGSSKFVIAVTIRSVNSENDRKAADDNCLNELSSKTGVDIKEIYDEAPLLGLVNLIEQIKPISVYTGKPGKGSNFVGQLALLCNTDVSVVADDGVYIVTPDSELNKD